MSKTYSLPEAKEDKDVPPRLKEFQRLNELLWTIVFKELNITNGNRPRLSLTVFHAAHGRMDPCLDLASHVKHYVMFNGRNFEDLSDTAISVLQYIWERMEELVQPAKKD